jgi:hypothetical protein
MPSRRPKQTLESVLHPKGLEDRLCSKCKLQPRRLALSWCQGCISERRRMREQEKRGAA